MGSADPGSHGAVVEPWNEFDKLGVAAARMPARANKGHGKAMARKYLWGAQEPDAGGGGAFSTMTTAEATRFGGQDDAIRFRTTGARGASLIM